MRAENIYPFIYTIFFILISGLAFFAFSSQKSDHDTAAAQNEELATDYIEASNTGDFDILESSLTETGAEMLSESVVLEACYEQLGAFLVPASEAKSYLPEGFEPYQPEDFDPQNWDPSGEFTVGLSVWSIDCEPVHENEEPLNMVWMTLSVDPTDEYRSDDVNRYSVPVRIFTSSPALVETLHGFGIPQAKLSDVTHEIKEPADTVRTGLTHASAGGDKITMESHVAGSPTPSGEDGARARIFGVKDGQVSGVADFIISDYHIMPGKSSLTGNTLFSGQTPESIFSVHAWEIEFHLEPVEYR
jgi:hypothetical protein